MRGETFTQEHNVIKSLKKDQCGGGPTLIRKHNKTYCYGGESHAMITGGSGSGKTTTTTLPLLRGLLESDESVVVIDPKGDLLFETECFIPEHYETLVIDFQKPYESTKWSPLESEVSLVTTSINRNSVFGSERMN